MLVICFFLVMMHRFRVRPHKMARVNSRWWRCMKTDARPSPMPKHYKRPPPKHVPTAKWSTRFVAIDALVATTMTTQQERRVVDVGCDHAWLSIGLVSCGTARSAIAIDVNEKPLEGARNNKRKHADELPIEFRLGSGLEPVACADECNVAIFAGFGISAMTAALEQATFKPKNVVLNPPAKHAPQARRWLVDNGYAIVGEACVVEGGVVNVVEAATFVGVNDDRCTSTNYDDILLGPLLRRETASSGIHFDAFQALLAARLRGVDDAIRRIPGRGVDDANDNDNDNDDDDVESLVGTMDRSRDHTRRRQKSHAELLRERRSLLAHL